MALFERLMMETPVPTPQQDPPQSSQPADEALLAALMTGNSNCTDEDSDGSLRTEDGF